MNCQNVAELVTQEVSVTMVTFHIPKKIKLQCEIMSRVIGQTGEKEQKNKKQKQNEKQNKTNEKGIQQYETTKSAYK